MQLELGFDLRKNGAEKRGSRTTAGAVEDKDPLASLPVKQGSVVKTCSYQ